MRWEDIKQEYFDYVKGAGADAMFVWDWLEIHYFVAVNKLDSDLECPHCGADESDREGDQIRYTCGSASNGLLPENFIQNCE